MFRNFTPAIQRQGSGMGGDWPQPLQGARRGLVWAEAEDSEEAVESEDAVEKSIVSKGLASFPEFSDSPSACDGVIIGSTNDRSTSPNFFAKSKSTNLVITTGTQIVLCIANSPRRTPNAIPTLPCELILILITKHWQ